ncbi:MAG: hypothetical protein R3D98_12085 [Candidatus Krumholzibacteriia bacterium]
MQRFILPAAMILAAATLTTAAPTITCPFEPPATREVHLTRRWILDPDDEATPLLGVIRDAARGPAGQVYLLDMQLCHVLEYDDRGTLVRTLGREGDGPGEFRRSSRLLVHADGDLGVQQDFPLKLERLHPDGTPAGRWTPANKTMMATDVALSGRRLVLCGQSREQARSTPSKTLDRHTIALYDADGEPTCTFASKEVETSFDPAIYDEAQADFPGARWCVTSDGLVVIAPDRDRYHLEYYRPDGELVQVVDRPITPHRRTADELAERRQSVSYSVGGQQVAVDCRLLDHDPVISRLRALPDGQVGVVHAGLPRDTQDPHPRWRWDVHDRSGRLTERVTLVADAEARAQDLWIVLDGLHAVCLHEFLAAVTGYWAGQGQEMPALAGGEDAPHTVSYWSADAQATREDLR